ncbi:hypothetical protein BD779DRAFT_1468520 [Infundibulicybe gibba]|nr:hypothetical protein BD779DRAFT_1468520 [Infundibulicybe gibba]
MGRALFSQTYSSPAVRTEPEPGLVSCEKWSRCNPFDPDSDEFFNDAEYEAFVDPVDYRVVASERSGSPAFSDDSSSSERASSPIASPDDPQAPVIVAGWEQRILTGATEWRQNSDPSALLALFGPRAQRAAADDPAPRPPRNRTRSATTSPPPPPFVAL